MEKLLLQGLLPLMILLVGCSNEDLPVQAIQQNDLAGSNLSVGKRWKLSTLYVGSTPQTLTYNQRLYTKTYYPDGRYSDSDGISGTWTIPVADSLVETYTNFPINVPVKQGYKINNLSNALMSLSHAVNGTYVTSTYNQVP